MRLALIATVCAVLFAVPVLAENGPICILSDATGSSCSFTDTGGLMEFYVIHQPEAGVTAVDFSAPIPACMSGASWVGDINPYVLTLGDSQTGMAVAYTGCTNGPILVTTIQVATTGASQTDCAYPVLPSPAVVSGSIEAVDCNSTKHLIPGGTAYINSTLACTCETVEAPVLAYSPSFVDFGLTSAHELLDIRNDGGGSLSWSITEYTSWLNVFPVSGSGNTSVSLTVDRSTLANGTHTALLNISSNGGSAQVPVSIESASELMVLPAELWFEADESHKTLDIRNTGTGWITWDVTESIPWLVVQPGEGTGETTLDVWVNRVGLAQGLHNGDITVNSDGGNAQVPVALVVGSADPLLGATPGSLSFGVAQTQKTVNIFNAGTGTLTWDVASSELWMSVSPVSGTGDGSVAVTIDRTGLADGPYSGFVQVTSNGGDADIPVGMVVDNSPQLGVSRTTLLFSPSATVRTFAITNLGGGTLDWQLSADKPWIGIDPPLTGSGNATVTVRIDLNQIPGDQVETGIVTVSSNGGVETLDARYTPPGPGGQAGAIMLYGDPGYNTCNVVNPTGVFTLYIQHDLTSGTTASQFALTANPGMIYLADQVQGGFLSLGDSQTGIALTYGACMGGPVNILNVLYSAAGPAPCSTIEVVPDPDALTGQIEGVDCALNKNFPNGAHLTFNGDTSCPCGTIVRTEATTWGGVKALYLPEGEDKR